MRGESGTSGRVVRSRYTRGGRRAVAMAATAAVAAVGSWSAMRPAPVRADTFGWTGGVGGNDGSFSSTNYVDPNNWTNASSGSGVPGAADTGIINDGTVANFNPGDAQTTGTLYIGDNVGIGQGFLTQTGGTLNISNYLGIGYAGATLHSEYDISGGTLNATGTFIQLLGSAGSVDSAVMKITGTATVNAVGTDKGAGGGASFVAGDNGGYGHLYLSDTATLNTMYLAYVGAGTNSIGIMEMSGGTFNMGSGLRVGAYGATGVLNMTGGTVLQSNASNASYLGYLASTGTWNVSAGSVNMAGELRVGGSDTSGVLTGNGYLNVTGGNVTLGALTLARGNNFQNVESGYLNLIGGTVTSVNDVIAGFAGAGTAGINISGGTLNVATTTLKWLQVGVYDTTKSFVNISSGAIKLNTNSAIRFSTGGNTGGNVFNQLGGTVTFYSDNGVTIGGVGVLDMQQGGGNTNNTYNLYGGTLTVPQIISAQTNGTRTFNFSGGLLRAAGASTAFMAGNVATTANVQANGALIDTNGFAITIGQALSHDATLGATLDGGLSVNSSTGTGALTLTGVSTYTGPTTIGANTTLTLGNGTTGNDGSIGPTSGVANGGALVFNRFGSTTAGYAIAGVGTVAKLGVGTQVLTGVNTYGGATTITGGTLALSGGGSINNTPGISVGASGRFLQLSSVASTPAITLAGTLDGVGTVGATTVSAGGIVNNGNGSTGILNLSSLAFLGAGTSTLNLANTNTPALNVAGLFSVNGPAGKVTLNLLSNGGAFISGTSGSTTTYEVLSYANKLNNGVADNVATDYFTIGGGFTARQTATLSFNTTSGSAGYLVLSVTGSPGNTRWTGVNSNQWTTGTTGNWAFFTGGATDFVAGDAVTFDDVGAGRPTVDIASATVLPTTVTFNNSSVAYNIMSSGGFGIGNFSPTLQTTLAMNGSGSVTLSTSNSYAGGTFINAGTLNANSSSALGTGLVTVNGGTLNANVAGALGTTTIALKGGLLNIANASGIGTGALNISGGALGNPTGATLQLTTNNVQNWSGNFGYASPSQLNMGTGAITLAASPTITLGTNSILQEGGVVGGAFGLTLNGSSGSQLILTGTNTFTGAVVVNSGTLYAASPNAAGGGALRTVSGITVNNGATLLTSENGLFGATLANEKPITLNLGGTLNSSSATVTTHLGVVTLAGGNLAYPGTPTGDGLTYGSYDLDLGVVAGNSPNTSTISAVGIALTQTGGTVFNVASGTTASGIDLDVTGTFVHAASSADTGLVKTGTGVMRLSGTNTYTGATVVSNGQLVVASTGAITATTTVNVGTVSGTGAALYTSGLITNTSAGGGGFQIGGAVGALGYMSMTGGTVNAGGEIDPGGSAGGAGTFGQLDMTAGTINLPNLTGTYFLPVRGAAGEAAVTNFLGGTVQIIGGNAPTNNGINGLAVGLGNVGNLISTVTIGGTAQFLTPSLTVKLNDTNFGGTPNSTNVSVLNLNGTSTLQTLGFGTAVNQAATATNGNGFATVNLNGGTIKAGIASNSGFMANLGAAYVFAGGGTFDNNGQSITIGQALLTPTGVGVANVPVTSGGSGYTTPPRVVFASSDGVGNGATGYATISSTGAVTGIVITNPGTGYDAPPVVSFTATGTGTGAVIGTATTAVNVGGGLTLRGAGTTLLTGASTYVGATNVAAGTLALGGTGSINATSVINVNGTGARFLNVSTVASTAPITLTNGTLAGTGTDGVTTVTNSAANVIANGNASNGTLSFNALTFLGAGTANLNLSNGITIGALNVSGGLATNSSVSTVGLNLTVAGGLLTGSTYDLINYGSITNNGATATTAAGFTILSGLSGRQSPTLTLVSTGATSGYLSLTIGGGSAANTYWSGSNSNLWQTGTTGNWKMQSDNSTTDFFAGDFVTFDDRGANTNPISISAANVNPGSVTFNNSTATYNFSGGFGITGTGAVTKTNTGTVYLFTSNSYTGGTNISGGTVVINSAASLGDPSGAATINAATLDAAANINSTRAIALGSATSTVAVDSGFAYNVSGLVSGTGTLNKTGAGTLVLSTSNSYSGGTTISAGNVSISADNNLGPTGTPVTMNGGTLTNTAGLTDTHPITFNAAGGTINVTSSGQFYIHTANTLLGSGPMSVTGNGTLVSPVGNVRIDVTNTYSGPVTVQQGGIFEYGILNAVASGSTFNVSSQGEVAVQTGVTMPNSFTVSGGTNSVISFENGNAGVVGGPVVINGNLTVGLRDWYNYATVRSGTISGLISGTGGIITTPGTATAGNPVLTLINADTYTGATTVAANTTLQLGNGATNGSIDTTSNVVDNGVLTFNRNTSSATTSTFTPVISGAGTLTKAGVETLVLTGANTYSGTTSVVGNGILSVSSIGATTSTSSNLGVPINASGGAILLSGSGGSGQLTYTGAGETSDRQIGITGGTTGATNGILDQSGTGKLTFSTGGVYSNGLAHTLVLQGSAAGAGEIDGGVNNGTSVLALVKQGTGKWILGGNSNYSGGTTVAAGTLVANNATASLGTGQTNVSGGVLAGNGSTGGAVLVNGGKITAGSGATTADTVGALSAPSMNWSSGTYTSKFVAATGPGVGNDLLIASTLSLPTTAAGFTVNVQTPNGAAPAIPAGSYIVLAVDKDATTANPFNASSTAYLSTFNNLVLQVNGGTVPAGYAYNTQADTTGNGGFDLILASTAAAPEPTSLLMLAGAATPLVLGRRRRQSARRMAV